MTRERCICCAAPVPDLGPVTSPECLPGTRRGIRPTVGGPVGNVADPGLSMGMGHFFDRTGLRLAGHMFTVRQGDYHEIDDELPKGGRR